MTVSGIHTKTALSVCALILISALLPPDAHSQEQEERFFWHGQLRSGYYFNNHAYRDDPAIGQNEWRTRIQLGFQYRLSDQFDFRARLGGRFSTIQEKFRFQLSDHTPGATGLRLGESTLDEFNLTWSSGDRFWVRAGRFQLSFPLRGVLSKGLSRYDSPNTSVVFTDGLWVRWMFHDQWNLHMAAEYNSAAGASTVARYPLAFESPESRVSFWSMIQHRRTEGFWTQREVSLHYLPGCYPDSDGSARNHMVFTTRLGIRPPITLSWSDLSVGFEGGYVPQAPSAESDDLHDSFAWQAALNFRDLNFFGRTHNFGILYGRVDPGWLTSPSFLPNSETFEARYQLLLTRSTSFEIRYRYRPELKLPAGAEGHWHISDIYARVTLRI